MRGTTRHLALAVVATLAACGHGIEPSGPNLGGHWRGAAVIGAGLPTPLDMTLADDGGQVTGNGGHVDCRYFTYCGSFGTYTVAGTHDDEWMRLQGTSIYDRTWLLEAHLEKDGTLAGTVTGSEFLRAPFTMARAD